MKKARMNISHSRFILLKLKIFNEIVTTFFLWCTLVNGGPVACYATATRVSHCNKLLSMNLLFLIIFNKFTHAVLQRANFGILTKKCLFAL